MLLPWAPHPLLPTGGNSPHGPSQCLGIGCFGNDFNILAASAWSMIEKMYHHEIWAWMICFEVFLKKHSFSYFYILGDGKAQTSLMDSYALFSVTCLSFESWWVSGLLWCLWASLMNSSWTLSLLGPATWQFVMNRTQRLRVVLSSASHCNITLKRKTTQKRCFGICFIIPLLI